MNEHVSEAADTGGRLQLAVEMAREAGNITLESKATIRR